MKKFFIVALAALGFVACSDENLDDVNGGYSGEVETSYIAINLSAADNGTRANDGTYQEGLATERAVETACFFFFKDNGDAFPVTATGPGNGVNWISANLTDIGQEMPNVSDVKDVVLILNKYVGTYPNQIVAVLNWVPENKAYNLSELYSATNVLNELDGTNYFVMSNAVYSDGSQAIVGTPLTASDIYKDEANALANPITIHVERIAAKVTVTANDVADNRFLVDKDITIGGADKDVYVEVAGWALHNDFAQSKLLKEINPAWSDTDLGFTWNDSPWYRCYWANSLAFSALEGKNDFPETLSYDLGSASDVNDGTYADNTYTYVGENTLYDGIDTDDCTKVILKAELQNEDGSALSLARWYATYYAGEEDLLKAVANTIKYQYYYISEYDGTQPRKYTTIGPDDLMTVQNGNKVQFQLSTAGGVGVNRADGFFVKANDNSGNYTYTSITNEALNAALASIEEAVYYKNGETLYYVDIKHLGNSGTLGEFGVVRNHIYNVVLKSFGGFGSPVYDPEDEPIEYPVPPGEDESGYVSAEVRVLSWRLITQEVDVQPQQ